tara:strand:- start:655 stop:912 length:258 start_codon:yes stop_codon:yes gene_type:complete
MAQLNWQKDKDKRLAYESSRDPYNRSMSESQIWPILGKHQGKLISRLSLDYLHWIGMNFHPRSRGYKLAVRELELRANGNLNSCK